MSTCRSRSFKKKKKRHTVNTVNTNPSYVLTCHSITKYTCVTIRIKMLERLFSTFAYFEISIMECSRARVCVCPQQRQVCVYNQCQKVCVDNYYYCLLMAVRVSPPPQASASCTALPRISQSTRRTYVSEAIPVLDLPAVLGDG